MIGATSFVNVRRAVSLGDETTRLDGSNSRAWAEGSEIKLSNTAIAPDMVAAVNAAVPEEFWNSKCPRILVYRSNKAADGLSGRSSDRPSIQYGFERDS